MSDLQDQIEEAYRQVGICRRRAERHGSGLEDEFALEKARNRLLTLELRQLRQGNKAHRQVASAREEVERQHSPRLTAKDRADLAFAALTKGGA